MDRMGSNWSKVLLWIAVLLAAAWFVIFRGLSQSMVVLGPITTTVTSRPATTQAAGEGEGRTWEIAALASPGRFERGEDAVANELIERHNANQDRLGKVRLRGQCVWMLDMPGEPRAMTIEFDRAKDGASLTCGKDKGWTKDGTVHMSPGSAMNIDALYLLMFRKYNAKEFHAAAGAKDGETVAVKSEREMLVFEKASGRLVEGEFQVKEGVVRVKFGEFKAIDKAGKAVVPTFVDVMVPVDLFPFERTRDGRVTLRIDAEGCAVD